MAVISVRIDEETKEDFEHFCRGVGSNTSTVLKMFATKVAREQRLPFSVEIDPFYSRANIAELERRAEKAKSGTGMHEHDLIKD